MSPLPLFQTPPCATAVQVQASRTPNYHTRIVSVRARYTQASALRTLPTTRNGSTARVMAHSAWCLERAPRSSRWRASPRPRGLACRMRASFGHARAGHPNQQQLASGVGRPVAFAGPPSCAAPCACYSYQPAVHFGHLAVRLLLAGPPSLDLLLAVPRQRRRLGAGHPQAVPLAAHAPAAAGCASPISRHSQRKNSSAAWVAPSPPGA